VLRGYYRLLDGPDRATADRMLAAERRQLQDELDADPTPPPPVTVVTSDPTRARLQERLHAVGRVDRRTDRDPDSVTNEQSAENLAWVRDLVASGRALSNSDANTSRDRMYLMNPSDRARAYETIDAARVRAEGDLAALGGPAMGDDISAWVNASTQAMNLRYMESPLSPDPEMTVPVAAASEGVASIGYST
jgi:hypothetical protein